MKGSAASSSRCEMLEQDHGPAAGILRGLQLIQASQALKAAVCAALQSSAGAVLATLRLALVHCQ